jgi:hypothetical protein
MLRLSARGVDGICFVNRTDGDTIVVLNRNSDRGIARVGERYLQRRQC